METREQLIRMRDDCQKRLSELNMKIEKLDERFYYEKLLRIISMLKELPDFYETDDLTFDIECLECGEQLEIDFDDIIKCFETFRKKVEYKWE